MAKSILILMTYHLKLLSWPIRWMVIIKKISDIYQGEKDAHNDLIFIGLKELIFQLKHTIFVWYILIIFIYIYIFIFS